MSGGLILVAAISLAACGPSQKQVVSGASTTTYSTTTSAGTGTTSTSLLTHVGGTSGALARHIWGNGSILVPAGWVEHDEIPGGSSDIVTFDDPASPANLVVTINSCVLCGTTPSGQPQPSNYLPSSGVISSRHLDAYRLAYVQRSTTPNDVTNGLIVDLHIGREPNGTITAAITLPVTQHDLATTILDSLQTA